jgi:hypothetical protein
MIFGSGLFYTITSPPREEMMSNQFAKLFTAHPQSVDETYFEHLLFAAKFSAKLFMAGFLRSDPCDPAVYL